MNKTAALFLASVFCLLSSHPAHAQFIGYVAGQTASKSFSISVTNASKTFTLPNLGQVGHSVQYQWQSTNPCGFVLDGSQDGTNWSTLAAGISSTGTNNLYSYGNGYFSQLRLKVNPSASTCTGTTFKGVYAGYQTPLPLVPIFTTTKTSNIASPVAGNTSYGTPVLLGAFQCFNPSATATAYVQLFDSASTPTLGASVIYEIGIGPLNSYNFPAAVFFVISHQLWFGAATAAGGATPVASPLTCNAQLSFTGPFYPLSPDDTP